MKLTIQHRRMNGTPVTLVVDVEADGAIEYWRSEDPRTGAHVALDEGEKWWAVAEMHRAIAKMTRGAA